jgi:hypothetical protein
VQARTRELTESLEQQTATSEVLGVISNSPGELAPVFQAMLENATRVCGAEAGLLYRLEGQAFRIEAQLGVSREFVSLIEHKAIEPEPVTVPILSAIRYSSPRLAGRNGRFTNDR